MPQDARTFAVRTDAAGEDRAVSAREYRPSPPALGASLILAHGAGAGHDSPFMVAFASALAARGLQLFTFNFPYIDQKRRLPDKNPTLEACWRAVIAAVREMVGDRPLFIGGKSMGGRIASQVAASDGTSLGVRGLVFLGYPLHPPRRPEQLRVDHWPAVAVPVLFIQGARDAFGTPEELRRHLPRLEAGADLVVLDAADHSLKVRTNAQRGQGAVYAEAQDAIVAWIRQRGGFGLTRGSTSRP